MNTRISGVVLDTLLTGTLLSGMGLGSTFTQTETGSNAARITQNTLYVLSVGQN